MDKGNPMSTANAGRARTLRAVADAIGEPQRRRQKLEDLTKRRDPHLVASDARYLQQYDESTRQFIKDRRKVLADKGMFLDKLERLLNTALLTPKSNSPKSKSPKSKSPKSKSPKSKSPKSKSPRLTTHLRKPRSGRRLSFVDA